MFQSKLSIPVALVAAGALAFAARPVLFQEMEMPQPTKEHAFQQQMVGEWSGTLTSFMAGMSEEPVRATETVSSHGPFWTTSNFECDFQGMPYNGHGCQGYDPGKGKHTATWIDNFSSYLAIMEGDYDQATSTLTMHWDAPDMTGTVVPHRFDMVLERDHYVSTFYTNDAKSMVIEMERTVADPEAEPDSGGR